MPSGVELVATGVEAPIWLIPEYMCKDSEI